MHHLGLNKEQVALLKSYKPSKNICTFSESVGWKNEEELQTGVKSIYPQHVKKPIGNSIESPVTLRTGIQDGQLHSANCVYHNFGASLLDLHAVIPLVNQWVINSGSGRKPFSVIPPVCVEKWDQESHRLTSNVVCDSMIADDWCFSASAAHDEYVFCRRS